MAGKSAGKTPLPGEVVPKVPAGNGETAAPHPFRQGAPLITEQELQRRAAIVEQEANHDLKHLVGLLDLSEAQQDRIFDTLARRSPAWHGSMQPVGVLAPIAPSPDDAAPSPAPRSTSPGEIAPPGGPTADDSPIAANETPLLDEIADELTPEQLIELADAELARQEWWEEIIPKLLPGSDILDTAGSIPGDTGTGTAAAAAPPPPPSEEGPAETKSGDDVLILD